MSAREDILDRIRHAKADRSVEVPRGYRRADAATASLGLFVDRVEDYRAVVHRASLAEVPALLGRLADGRLVVPEGVPAEWLGGLTFDSDEPLSTEQLDRVDTVLTTCALAIAETGTIVLDAGPGQGRRALTLIPDHHVVVVRASQVVATVPQAVAQLDPRRPQTWISGPSATSDIELQRVEGVHGPRRLDVVLVTEPNLP
jgi:L-lactate dehydrogenase complex protein LldG